MAMNMSDLLIGRRVLRVAPIVARRDPLCLGQVDIFTLLPEGLSGVHFTTRCVQVFRSVER